MIREAFRKVLFALVLLVPTVAAARPVVIELFTSEACSSCPPADALLGRLKRQGADLLLLDLHITYWNGSGWTDPFSLAAATERQQWYASLGNSDEVYTPEAVVDGRDQMVGSDRGALLSAIARERSAAAQAVPVTIVEDGGEVRVGVGAGAGPARLWLFGFDDMHTTHIGGGENSGATLTEVNVVRAVRPLGLWNGGARSVSVARPAGMHVAVLLQRDDGEIIGAAAD